MSREIYQDIVLDHFRNSRLRISFDGNDESVHSLRNPGCGDLIKLKVSPAEDGSLKWEHDAQGCAASVASTSIMCDHLTGRKKVDADELILHFLEELESVSERTFEQDDSMDIELEALLYFRNVPARKICVSLAWNCAQKALAALDGAA